MRAFRIPCLVLLGLVSSLVGCSDDGFSTTPDSGSASEGGLGCSEGETRCDVNRYLRCENGRYKAIEICSSGVCLEGQGCADCDPAIGRGCQDNAVYSCNADGSFGELIEQCITDTCQNGACGGGNLCSDESQLIYVVDSDNHLLSFSPVQDAHTFELIAQLDCPAGPALDGFVPATPFSMSVDRSAQAWVLYSSGEIFWVDVKTGQCQVSTYQPGQLGFQLFGMGFVSDAPGSDQETLYIAGGGAGNLQSGALGTIDPETLQVARLGAFQNIEQLPELTGTGNAALFGYFPGMTAPFVAELDKETAAQKNSWPLTALPGQVMAWAFAHWGGRFYIFATTMDLFFQEKSQVLRLDPSTGDVQTIIDNSPYRIVGAGVSTCAPVIE